MFEKINIVSLPGSFMAIGLLGFIATAIFRDTLGLAWTFALSLFCLILFIASFISLHYGPISEREIKY